MNNNYNQIALSEIGRWIDKIIEFLFEKHLWLGIIVLLLLIFFIYKFWRRPIE